MLESVLSYLNNYFVHQTFPAETWTISDGSMEIPGALDGQYVRIVGSVLNDGVYLYPLTGLSNETFSGTVQLLAVPKAVVALADEIKTWADKNQPSAYTSESFGGYSYSKEAGAGWQAAYRHRLAPWRKMKQH